MRIFVVFFLFTALCTTGFSQSASFTTDLSGNQSCGAASVNFTIDDLTGISTYEWDFGNGEPNASGTIGAGDDGSAGTTYLTPGVYTAQLTVNGSISTVQSISINAPPEPNFTASDNEECLVNTQDVSFTYTGVTPSFGAPISEWKWNFGDGTPAQTVTGTGNTVHTYSKFGEFNVLVSVTDDNGCKEDYFIPSAVKLYSTPVADFTVDYSSNCNFPLALDITDQSSDGQNSISSYEWTLENKITGATIQTSSDQKPNFSIPGGGTYDIILRVTNSPNMCVDEVTKTFSFEANTIDFSSDLVEVCQGQNIQFTNLALDGNGGAPIAYEWDFGDGNTSTKANPTHQYNSVTGSPFDVTLKVTFSNGCESNLTKDTLITVNPDTPPTISVDMDENCKDYQANFTATPGLTLYEWDFNYDGTTPNFTTSGPDDNATFNYTGEDTIQVLLQTTSSTGCVQTVVYDSITIIYPVADFIVTQGQEGCVSLQADFDASSSINLLPSSSNAIINYSWDFENDGSIDFSSASPTADFTYSSEGVYDVRLIVETEESCFDTVIINADIKRGLEPTAMFDYSQADLCRNTPVQFTNSSIPSAISLNPIDSLIWNFGDGTVIAGNPITNPGINTPSHTYLDDTDDNNTPFTVTLIALSSGCESLPVDTTVNISYPIARFDQPVNPNCSPIIDLDFTAYDAGDPDRLSEGVEEYRWDFGDGQLFPGPTASDYANGFDPTTSHEYLSLGNFDVTLYVKNTTTGCEDEFTSTVPIKVGIANFNADQIDACRNDSLNPINFNNLSQSTSANQEFTWDFGAGAVPQTYIGQTPPPVYYTSDGQKTVTLTMDQQDGCLLSEVKAAYITVGGPTPDFTITSTNADNQVQCISPIENITFTSTTSASPNPFGNRTYSWDFGVGATPATADRLNEAGIQVRYDSPGNKVVSLTVVDGRGCQITYTQNNAVTVPDVQSDFDVDPTPNLCISGQQTFKPISTNTTFPLTNWDWTFAPDGTPANANNNSDASVDVQFGTAGTKTTTLTVTDQKGCTSEKSIDTEIYEANASFITPPASGCAPATTTFVNTSTGIQSYEWDFGDGNTSTDRTPTNIYLYPGVYDVTLKTVSLGGCEATETKASAVTIEGSYFNDFSYAFTDSPCLDSPNNPEVTFSITGLVDTKIIRLDFGDGTPSFIDTLPDASNPPAVYTVSHTYDKIGSFEPKLTLEDDPSVLGACGAFVYIPTVPPVIISEPPVTDFSFKNVLGEVCQGETIQFTDESTLADTRYVIDSWSWDFGDPSGGTSTQQNPDYTFNTAGSYDVQLIASSDYGCPDTAIKTVVVVTPISDLTTGGNFNKCDSIALTLDAEAATGGDGNISYLWEISNDNSTWNTAPGVNDQEDYDVEDKSLSAQQTFYYRRVDSSATCTFITPVFEVQIDPVTTPGNIDLPATECFADNMQELELKNNIGAVQEWNSSPDIFFNTFTVIPNTTNKETYTDLTQTSYYRVLVQSGICPENYSDTIEIEVLPEITGNRIDPDTALCSDIDIGTITATSPMGGEGNFTFQWQESTDNINFTDIGSATSEDYAPGVLTQTTFFRRAVTSNGNCVVYSDTMEVNITQAPDTTLNVIADNVCDDQDATVTIQNSENAYTYNVLDVKNANAIAGTNVGNGNDLDISIPETSLPVAGEYFTFEIEAINGICTRYFPLDSLLIDSIPDLTLGVSDIGDLCVGNDGEVTISGAQNGYTYEVQDIDNANQTVASGTGANTDLVLTIPASELPAADSFRYRIQVTNGACEKILNNQGSFFIIGTPDITIDLSDPSICPESSPVTVDIDMSTSEQNVSYQLRLNADDSPIGSPLAGNGSPLSFTITTPLNTTDYNVLASPTLLDGLGNSCPSVEITDLAEVQVIPGANVSLTVSDPIICIGDDAVITISNTENNVVYYLNDGLVDLDSANGTGSDLIFTLSPGPTTDIDYIIFARPNITGVLCQRIQLSDLAQTTVIPVPDNTATVSDHDICEGDGSFSISVNPTSTEVNYSLYSDSGVLIETLTGTGSILNFTPIPEPIASTTYEVYATPAQDNDQGQTCDSIKITDESIVTFAPAPNNSLTVNGDSICLGNDGTIEVLASESNIQYLLSELPSGSIIDGPITGNGGTLTFAPLSPTSTTSYQVQAFNDALNCDTINIGNLVEIVVIPAPSTNLSITPTAQTICSGDNQIITVDGTEIDILYQLRIGTTDVPGQSFVGNGASQDFTVSPTANTVYNVFATPVNSGSGGTACVGVQLDALVNISVEGPITITKQPANAQVCSGTVANFSIEADAGNGGTLEYQWFRSNDNVTFNKLSEGGDFTGTQSQTLTINNSVNYNGEFFLAKVATANCDSVTSNSASLQANTPPDPTSFAITTQDICFGADEEVQFTSNLSNGESYDIVYNLSGANTGTALRSTTIISSLDGSGSFIIPSSDIPNVGASAITVTEIDFSSGSNCQSTGLAITDVFTIEAIPDTTGITFSSPNICQGDSNFVDVDSQLEDEIYEIVYTLGGANPSPIDSAELGIIVGKGNFLLLNTKLTNPGNTSVAIQKIKYNFGQFCSVDSINDTVFFEVEPTPDVSGFTISVEDLCLGDDGVVEITSNLPDGFYNISYTIINGVPDMGNSIVEFSSGDGSATFTIPSSLILETGSSSLTINAIQNNYGESCEVDGLNISDNFEVDYTPDLTGASLVLEDICQEADEEVILTSNLIDGNYSIEYNLTGANAEAAIIENVTLNTGDGNIFFTIPSSKLLNDGLQTVTLTNIINLDASPVPPCQATTIISSSFTIQALPDTIGLVLDIPNTCPQTPATVTVNSQLRQSTYNLAYGLSGANSASGLVSTFSILPDGSGSFDISGSDLTMSGTTTLSIDSIQFASGLQCVISNFTNSYDFEVEPQPNAQGLSLTSNDICLGDSALVDVNSNLTDGSYEIEYDIFGINATSIITDSIISSGGAANFTIDKNNLNSAGLTGIVISKIKAQFGQFCETIGDTLAQTIFRVEPNPDTSGLQIFAYDACENTDILVEGVSDLDDGNYTFTYNISGKNIVASQSVSIPLSAGNGTFSFNIPFALLPISGSSTIHLESIQNEAGQNCAVNVNVSSNFTIIPLPDITNLAVQVDSICQGIDIEVNLSGMLEDGNYDLAYDITGANPKAGQINNIDFMNGDGTASFTLPSTDFPTPGDNSIVINAVENTQGSGCSTPVVNVSDMFNIEESPDPTGFDITVTNICLGADALPMVSGNLKDNSYNLYYSLDGVNVHPNQNTPIIISGNAGEGNFVIPFTLLDKGGNTLIVADSIANVGGLNCTVPLIESEDFNVINIGSTFSGSIAIEDICLNDSAIVDVNTNISNGNYRITYNLTGANNFSNIVEDISIFNGQGSFIIPTLDLTVGGTQIATIISIEVLGVSSCHQGGLSVDTTFNIEGPISITSQPLPFDDCPGSRVEFSSSGISQGLGVLQYQWQESSDGGSTFNTIINNEFYSGTNTPTLTILDNELFDGSYFRMGLFTDKCKTVYSDSVLLSVLQGSVCGDDIDQLPNAISPNGDGKNDFWLVEGLQFYPNNTVQIFNRWGQLVYEANGYDNQLNRFEGIRNTNGSSSELVDGTYFYLIDFGDGQEPKKGYLVINR